MIFDTIELERISLQTFPAGMKMEMCKSCLVKTVRYSPISDLASLTVAASQQTFSLYAAAAAGPFGAVTALTFWARFDAAAVRPSVRPSAGSARGSAPGGVVVGGGQRGLPPSVRVRPKAPRGALAARVCEGTLGGISHFC